jgi:hypothetical protein
VIFDETGECAVARSPPDIEMPDCEIGSITATGLAGTSSKATLLTDPGCSSP